MLGIVFITFFIYFKEGEKTVNKMAETSQNVHNVSEVLKYHWKKIEVSRI